MNKPLFGTAGTSESFKTMGYKSSAQVPEYTAAMGLDAFEYQCGRGVRLGTELAKTIRAGAEARGICFSPKQTVERTSAISSRNCCKVSLSK